MKDIKTTSRRAFIRKLTKIMALSTLAVSLPDKIAGQLLKGKIKLFNGKNLDGWYTYLKDRGRNNDPENARGDGYGSGATVSASWSGEDSRKRNRSESHPADS